MRDEPDMVIRLPGYPHSVARPKKCFYFVPAAIEARVPSGPPLSGRKMQAFTT
jgi:hypothetical protein